MCVRVVVCGLRAVVCACRYRLLGCGNAQFGLPCVYRVRLMYSKPEKPDSDLDGLVWK